MVFRLQETGLINDREFAAAWATSRHNHKKISKRIIAGELRQKGVLQEQIDEALDGIDDESEYRAAFDLAFKKFNTMSRLEPDVQIRRRYHQEPHLSALGERPSDVVRQR